MKYTHFAVAVQHLVHRLSIVRIVLVTKTIFLPVTTEEALSEKIWVIHGVEMW